VLPGVVTIMRVVAVKRLAGCPSQTSNLIPTLRRQREKEVVLSCSYRNGEL